MKNLKRKVAIFMGAILVLFGTSQTVTLVFAQNTAPSGTSSETVADATEPSDVENLHSEPGDGEVKLTWDAANDNVAVASYKIYRGTTSVQVDEGKYDLPKIPVENVTTYTVKNLTNGQAYYFSITAVDAAGNESINYSNEASATPQSGLHLSSVEDDGKSPQVQEVETEDNITVKVVFSEPVKLPEETPESAFQIQKLVDKARLQVQNVQIDSRDELGKTIVLTTAPQEETEYVLTAGLEIEDYYGNAVISGTSDTGSFDGSAKKQRVAETDTETDTGDTQSDTTAPTLKKATADFNNRISVEFSETVRLPANPTNAFVIFQKGTDTKLKVQNASLAVEANTVYLTTDQQSGIEYELQVQGVSDASGNTMADTATITFTGRASALADTTPPEDVTNFKGRVSDSQKSIVELSWTASKNLAGDLADQMVYRSDGKNTTTFGAGSALGPNPTKAEFEDLKPGAWYTFKVTAKDRTGNESKGVVTAVYLPQTGPAAIAAGFTSLFMGVYSRRKRKGAEVHK